MPDYNTTCANHEPDTDAVYYLTTVESAPVSREAYAREYGFAALDNLDREAEAVRQETANLLLIAATAGT
jgi:hypothetical protein